VARTKPGETTERGGRIESADDVGAERDHRPVAEVLLPGPLDLHRMGERVRVGADRRVRGPERFQPARDGLVEARVEPARQFLGRLREVYLLERQAPLGLQARDVEAGSGKRFAVALRIYAAVNEPPTALGAERLERGDDRRELLLAPEENRKMRASPAVERRGEGAADHG
jgi:hypothetical protein